MLLDSAPTQQSSPSRQHSLVMPSLAPDKTPVRLRHNLRPPDRVACNANIFHKGGKKMDSDIPHLSLTFCHRASLPVCILCVQTFGLVCVCERFFLILETTPSPLWQMYYHSQLVTIYTMHMVYIVYVYSRGGAQPPDSYQMSAKAAHGFSCTVTESRGSKILVVEGFQLGLPLKQLSPRTLAVITFAGTVPIFVNGKY